MKQFVIITRAVALIIGPLDRSTPRHLSIESTLSIEWHWLLKLLANVDNKIDPQDLARVHP